MITHRRSVLVGVSVVCGLLLCPAPATSAMATKYVEGQPLKPSKIILVQGDRFAKGNSGIYLLEMKDAVSVTDVRFRVRCKKLVAVVWSGSLVSGPSPSSRIELTSSSGKRAELVEDGSGGSPFLRLPIKKGDTIRVRVTALDRSGAVAQADRYVSFVFGGRRCQ